MHCAPARAAASRLDDVLVDVAGGDDGVEERQLVRRVRRPAAAPARRGWPGSARASPRREARPPRASGDARAARRPRPGPRAAARGLGDARARPRRGRFPSRPRRRGASFPAACERLDHAVGDRDLLGVDAVDAEQAQDRALRRDRRVLLGLPRGRRRRPAARGAGSARSVRGRGPAWRPSAAKSIAAGLSRAEPDQRSAAQVEDRDARDLRAATRLEEARRRKRRARRRGRDSRSRRAGARARAPRGATPRSRERAALRRARGRSP